MSLMEHLEYFFKHLNKKLIKYFFLQYEMNLLKNVHD